ncbi:hypothetical protein pb186bvf_020831 [Paramecium bursaria]
MRPQTSSPYLMNRQEIYSIDSKQGFTLNSNHISFDFIFIKRPKFHVSRQQQDQNKEMIKGDAPNSREFKKTIPNNMTQDKERLYGELNKSKQLANQLYMNNYQLRVQVKSLEQVLKNQLTSKDESSEIFPHSALVAIPQAQKRILSDIPQLSITIQEEYKKQSQQYYDQEQNYQKTVKDKTQLKKDLQDLNEQFNNKASNDPQFRREQDRQRKLVECNQLKNDTMIKDKRINELERQLKDIKHNFRKKNSQKWEKLIQELIELQDKYQQLFFNSNRNLQPYQGNQAKEIRATNQQQEDLTPYAKRQFASRDTINENISKVSFQEQSEKQPKNLQMMLRRQLHSQDINQELKIYQHKNQILYLLNNKDLAETNMGELIQIFQKKTFDLNQNEWTTVARYLIEPYREKEITFNISLARIMNLF